MRTIISESISEICLLIFSSLERDKMDMHYLKDLSQEKRKHILERFFSGWDKKVEAEKEKGSIRVCKELNITGTNNPTYVYEPIDDWNVKLTLTI